MFHDLVLTKKTLRRIGRKKPSYLNWPVSELRGTPHNFYCSGAGTAIAMVLESQETSKLMYCVSTLGSNKNVCALFCSNRCSLDATQNNDATHNSIFSGFFTYFLIAAMGFCYDFLTH